VLNGGQAFVRRPTPARTRRDAGRIARLLPPQRTIYVLGYDCAPAADYSIDTIVHDVAGILRDEIGPQASWASPSAASSPRVLPPITQAS
jgi:hypothetical protein